MEILPIPVPGGFANDRALDEYAFSLKSLDAVKRKKKFRVEQVLSILVARDEVARSMGADDRLYLCNRSPFPHPIAVEPIPVPGGFANALAPVDDRLNGCSIAVLTL